MTAPLVSCLMPTANRRRYVPLALATFFRQDYPERELVVLDDGADPVGDLIPRDDPRVRYIRVPQGLSLGEKRNETCRLARGEVLVNWDDDDWCAPWRLSYQVQQLQSSGADVCGLDQLLLCHTGGTSAWRYRFPGGVKVPWLAGGTRCFRRQFWTRHPFPDIAQGEDTQWVVTALGARVLALAPHDFYVARVHDRNTSPKHTDGLWWTPFDSRYLQRLMGEDWMAFAGPPSAVQPLVSCILPTGGRRQFCRLAIERFEAQDYPRKELVIVDHEPASVEDLAAGRPGIEYIKVPSRQRGVSPKRNVACAAASGQILVQWDDDDWYGAERLSRQVAPLIHGRADITALEMRWVALLPQGEFWTVSPRLHRRMMYCDVHCGTLAFTRAMWDSGVRYSDVEWPEDAAFLHQCLRQGGRLLRVTNDDVFVYMRHAGTAWNFEVGRYIDPGSWARIQAPAALPLDLLARYQAAARDLARAVE